jgi:hypothetical protein
LIQSPPIVDLSALENDGLLLINDAQPAPAERTLIVLGVARSGTTMVAGALHHLGIPMGMGERPNDVFEDVELAGAVEGDDPDRLQALIARRNDAHAVWGWKRPSAITRMERLQRQFRNPEYLVVFRDVFAIANRNRISVRADIVANMEDTLRRYAELLSFLRTCTARALLISYEKAMLRPRTFVDALAAHVGVTQRPLIRAARLFVRPNPPDYLVSSRTWGGYGNLEALRADRVSGWAALRGEDKPARVHLWINGQFVATAVADLDRPDVRQRKVHPTGACGFSFELPAAARLQDGDTVRVRIEGEPSDLHGSPREFGARRPAPR